MKIRPLLLMIAAWFVPGLGHVLQKKYVRGCVFLLALAAMTALGLADGGKVYGFQTENPLTVLAFFSDLGSGLFYILARTLGLGPGYLERATFEFGTAFLAGAGLLNFLIAIDAHDIAAGKKS